MCRRAIDLRSLAHHHAIHPAPRPSRRITGSGRAPISPAPIRYARYVRPSLTRQLAPRLEEPLEDGQPRERGHEP